jgi:hypothetical protein
MGVLKALALQERREDHPWAASTGALPCV